MNRLLDPVRALVADLVRKRLWPVALLLVIALVAVPILVASSSSSEAPPPSGATVAATPEPEPAPAAAPADRPSAVEGEPAGRVRDPFFDPPAAPSEGEPSGQASAAASAAEPAKSAARSPAAKPADARDAKTGPARAAKPRSPRVTKRSGPPVERSVPATGTYHRTAASVRAGANVRQLTRLTPIGGRRDPAAVYLGVMKVGRPYAVFALGRHATSGGDGTCAVETSCRIIGLRPGDTQRITVYTADGHVARRYVVHVTSLKRITTSAANARAQRARVHPDGRAAGRAISRDAAGAAALRRVGYRRTTGLLFSEAANVLEQATR